MKTNINFIPIRPFAKANGLTKKQFVELAIRNGWYCMPSRYHDVQCDFGRYGRFAYFKAKPASLAGFRLP